MTTKVIYQNVEKTTIDGQTIIDFINVPKNIEDDLFALKFAFAKVCEPRVNGYDRSVSVSIVDDVLTIAIENKPSQHTIKKMSE